MRNQSLDVPRTAERIGGLIERTGMERYIGVLRGISARIPDHVLAEVDAMAALAGKSRNSMLVHLLETGLEEVRSTLNESTVDRLDQSTLKAQILLRSGSDAAHQGEI